MNAVPICTCPTCGAALELRHEGAFNAWTCPGGHGLGFTLTEAYERLPDDEIAAIWQLARQGAPGPRHCPMCARPMVTIAVPAVDDARPVDLDVCLVDELLWFDARELDRLPPDRPAAAPPDPTEEAEIAEITQHFGEGLRQDWAAEDARGVVGRVARRVGRHPLLDGAFGAGERPRA